ncbi:MAG: aromatic amino acid transaminase [Pseudomonadota bacterium]
MTDRLFAGVADSAPDPILSLMDRHRDDPRPHKVDLGVGVYRDETGQTPVMAAVKIAERQLCESQDSKAYVGLSGDPAFLDAFTTLAFGDDTRRDRLARIATPGGTGAVRQGLELVQRTRPEARIWLPLPTWPNHIAIAEAVGCEQRHYSHAAPGAASLDGDRMLADLAGMARGDLLVLHGCCHNPTGLDPSLDLWAEIAPLCQHTGAVPFVDLAYLGLGDGPQSDAAGLRRLAKSLPEMVLAMSGSKNFGLYRERVGLLAVLTESAADAERVQAALNMLNRLNYTFPPDHGARVAQMVLDDAELRAMWDGELAAMRTRLRDLRHGLADALEAEGVPDRGIRHGRGLFARLPLTTDRIAGLQASHGLYIVGDGRINIAGLRATDVERVAAGLAPLLR